MWQWIIAILGASMGVWNFLTLVFVLFLLLAAFSGSIEAWLIIGAIVLIFIMALIGSHIKNKYKDFLHERYKKVWEQLPEEEKKIWEEISVEVEYNDFGGVWERGEKAFENRFCKTFSFFDLFRKEFTKKVPFPHENWRNTIYVSENALAKIRKLDPYYDSNRSLWKWLAIISLLVIAIVVGVIYIMQQNSPSVPEMTPEERHQLDSIRQAYRREQDSIKQANKEAHEEYIRKMARDIVNSGRSEKRKSNNMRGWDPASEDDLDRNGMDRYMENDDEEGWD